MLGLGLGLSKTTNIVQSAGGNAFTADILDSVSTTPRIAYSLVRLKSTQTNCIQVRRASDNATQNIGFCNGIVDANAIATFCGASNGFISIWYDQSGNGYDMSQATTTQQPKIYDGTTGMLKDDNGNYAAKGDSANSVILTRSDAAVPNIFANSDGFTMTVLNAKGTDLSGNKSWFSDIHTGRLNKAFYSTITGSFTGNAWGVNINDGTSNNLGANMTATPIDRTVVFSAAFLSSNVADFDIWENNTTLTEIDGGSFAGNSGVNVISLFGASATSNYCDSYISTYMDFNQTVSASDKNTLRSYFTAQFVTAGEVNNTTYPQSC